MTWTIGRATGGVAVGLVLGLGLAVGCGDLAYIEDGDTNDGESDLDARDSEPSDEASGVQGDSGGGVVVHGLGAFHIDSLIFRKPAAPAALLNGVLGPLVSNGELILLIALYETASEGGRGNIQVVIGVGTNAPNGTYAWNDEAPSISTSATIDTSGSFTSALADQPFDIPVPYGRDDPPAHFNVPLQHVGLSGTLDGTGIVEGVLTGVVTFEDAASVEIDLGDPPPTLAEVLHAGNLDADLDGDGQLDGWQLEASFTASLLPGP